MYYNDIKCSWYTDSYNFHTINMRAYSFLIFLLKIVEFKIIFWILMHLVGVLDKFENGWRWSSFEGHRGQNVLFYSTIWWIKLWWPNLVYSNIFGMSRDLSYRVGSFIYKRDHSYREGIIHGSNGSLNPCLQR